MSTEASPAKPEKKAGCGGCLSILVIFALGAWGFSACSGSSKPSYGQTKQLSQSQRADYLQGVRGGNLSQGFSDTRLLSLADGICKDLYGSNGYTNANEAKLIAKTTGMSVEDSRYLVDQADQNVCLKN